MNRGQFKLIIIMSIFILPFFIAYFMLDNYSPGKSYSTTNYGDLVKPITNISNTVINDNNNEKSLPKGKWLLIYYANTQCGEECLHNIYLMRQVNTALGKNMDRLQRLFLSDKVLDENTEINLLRAYPNLILIKNKPNKIHGLIKGISDNKNSLLLVDPLGNVILKYDSNFDGKKLLKDIKKLLKLSRVG